MNYCQNCGKEKIAGTKFCSFCGQQYAGNDVRQPQFQRPHSAPPSFSPQFQTPAFPVQQEYSVTGGGNVPAKTGLVFFICAAVFTFIMSFLTYWTFTQSGRELTGFVSGTRYFNSMGGTILCLIAVFLAFLALLFSCWGIIRKLRKPERYGYLKTAIVFTVLSVGLLAIQFGSIAYGMVDYKSYYSKNTPAYNPPAAPDVSVQAKDLFAAYQGNKTTADSKFKGKRVRVLGIIASAGTDLTGKVFALLEGGSRANYVRCNFSDSMKSAVSSLKPYQTAIFAGTVEGDLYGDVLISNCSIEK